MINALFNQTNYVASKKLMDATSLRQEAIASNLGNVETSNYKRLDLAGGFKAQFAKALANGDTKTMKNLQPQLDTDPNAVSKTKDGNTVDLEEEMVSLNENALSHKLEAQLISGALARLRLAITGRR